MVQVNAGDDGAGRVNDVDRVQPAAQPHFQNDNIQPGVGQLLQKNQRGELEIAQRNNPRTIGSVGLLAGRFHRLKIRQDGSRADDLAAQAATLLKMHQMRGRIHAGAVTGLEQDGFEHGAGRALAVGAGHRDDRAAESQLHAAGHCLHPRQPHVDAQGVNLLAIRQPVVECLELFHEARIVAQAPRPVRK